MFQNETPDLPPLHPHQIVYLTCDDCRLYTEVIDILVDRQLAWVRPLALATPEDVLPLAASGILGLEDFNTGGGPIAPDLLWPLDQFSPALDTDFLDLLALLPTQGAKPNHPVQNAVVSQFTHRLWAESRTSAAHSEP
jgi:hypothetical protein